MDRRDGHKPVTETQPLARALAGGAATPGAAAPNPGDAGEIPPGLRESWSDPRYSLLEWLGRGGMGDVYLAYDRLAAHCVALKRVTSTRAARFDSENDLVLHRSLASEFRLLASLRHPNIISVLDYGFDHEGLPYFTMELLVGVRSLLEAGRGRGEIERLELVVQMLQALDYLHRRGVIHLDIKPSNVVEAGGRVKLLDFGVSILREEAEGPSDQFAGTLTYLAPELIDGQPPSESSDLFAAGVIAYELFAGCHPFASSRVPELLERIARRPVDLEPLGASAAVRTAIGRLLAKSPEQRTPSAAAALRDLRRVLGQPLDSEPPEIRESFVLAAPLVGRETEITRLSTALQAARRGRGGTWLVTGEAGIGKSRLLEELRALALVRGMRVLRGQAVPREASRDDSPPRSPQGDDDPYQPWRDIVRWLALLCDPGEAELAVLEAFVPDVRMLLGRPEEKTATPRDDIVPLPDVIERLLARLEESAVVILEDLHWAGPESLELLARLAEIAERAPILVAASVDDREALAVLERLRTCRPRRGRSVDVMQLHRLGRDSIAELTAAVLGDDVLGRRDDLVSFLERQTDGNVLFLLQVLRTLVDDSGRLERLVEPPCAEGGR